MLVCGAVESDAGVYRGRKGNRVHFRACEPENGSGFFPFSVKETCPPFPVLGVRMDYALIQRRTVDAIFEAYRQLSQEERADVEFRLLLQPLHGQW
jgi:hypothetical protein